MEMLARKKEDRPDAHTVASKLARLRGEGGVTTRSSTASMVLSIDALPSVQRTVYLAVFDCDDATKGFGSDLASSIADALARDRELKIVKAAPADSTIEATLRASGDRVRVRARLLDAKGEPMWADRFEGSLADPFALEDGTRDLIVGALRTYAGRAVGPVGPLREVWERNANLFARGIIGLREVVANLEEVERGEHAGDPWIATLLARALIGIGLQTGASDDALFARAEELALRALDRDPSNAQGYQAIAMVRSVRGEHAGALAAAREALRRSPLVPEAHMLIGRLLCWSGRVSEGLQRIELAVRLDPHQHSMSSEKIAFIALVGDRAKAERELAELEAQHPFAGVLPRLRLFSWWESREEARTLVNLMAKLGDSGASWLRARPMIEAYADGDMSKMREYTRTHLGALTSERVVARHRGFMHEVAAEMFLLMGEEDDALAHIIAASELPTWIDLLWLDRCPNLAPLRARPELARVRAVVAERVAQLFE
jgi:serine/threonine-protein kinase